MGCIRAHIQTSLATHPMPSQSFFRFCFPVFSFLFCSANKFLFVFLLVKIFCSYYFLLLCFWFSFLLFVVVIKKLCFLLFVVVMSMFCFLLSIVVIRGRFLLFVVVIYGAYRACLVPILKNLILSMG